MVLAQGGLSGFQTEVRRNMPTPAEVAADAPVEISVSLHPAVAHELAQFAKRSTFNTFYEFTGALAAAGYAPR